MGGLRSRAPSASIKLPRRDHHGKKDSGIIGKSEKKKAIAPFLQIR